MESEPEIKRTRVTQNIVLSVDGTPIIQMFYDPDTTQLAEGENIFNVEELNRGGECFYRLLDKDLRKRARYFQLTRITETEYKEKLRDFLK